MLDTIKIGGITYDILYPYEFTEDGAYLGLHVASESVLKVADTWQGHPRNKQMIGRTLLHEICHAIDNQYTGSILEEDDIDSIANGWYYILKHNTLFSKKFPDTVDINGVLYTLIYNHAFADIDASYITNNEALQIIFGPGTDQFIRCCLINAVHNLMCEDLKIDIPETCLSFGNGIYQVFIDNNIEKLIKRM